MARNFVAASSQLAQVPYVHADLPYTFAGWFRPSSLAGSQFGLYDFTNDYHHKYFHVTGTGVLGFDDFDAGGGGPVILASGTVSVGAWTHACATVTSTVSVLYRDGNANSQTVNAVNFNQVEYFRMGHGITGYFSGDIAEIALWNVALSTIEVGMLAIGISPLLIRPNAIVFYLPVMGTYSPEIELIGRRNVTLTNSPVVATHPRIWTPALPMVAPPKGSYVPSQGNMMLLF